MMTKAFKALLPVQPSPSQKKNKIKIKKELN